MGARKLSIGIAAIVGLIAALGLFWFISNLQSDAQADGEATTVFVVSEPFSRGASKSQVLTSIEEIDVPAAIAPSAAITDPESQILDDFVAVADFGIGHTLVVSDFASPRSAGTGLSAALEDGEVSVTISVDPIGWGAGLIRPGDHVNVLSVASHENPVDEVDEDGDPVAVISPQALAELLAAHAAAKLESVYVPVGLRQAVGANNGEVPTFDELTDGQRQSAIEWVSENELIQVTNQLSQNTSRYVLQDIRVLAIDTSIASVVGQTSEGEAVAPAAGSALVTLAVAPEDVQIVLNASRSGSDGGGGLYLSLVPESYVARPLVPLDPTRQIAPGEDFSALTGRQTGSVLNLIDGVETANLAPAELASADDAAASTVEDAPAIDQLEDVDGDGVVIPSDDGEG